jgi:hypothetical protein
LKGWLETSGVFSDCRRTLTSIHLDSGFLALQNGKPHDAVNSFREVYFVSKELSVYQGSSVNSLLFSEHFL